MRFLSFFSSLGKREKGHNIILQFRRKLDVGHKMAAVCAKFQIDPVKRCNTGQYFVSSLSKCAELVNWYIFKYITKENIQKLYGNTTFTFTHSQECHTWIISLYTNFHTSRWLGRLGVEPETAGVQTVEPSSNCRTQFLHFNITCILSNKTMLHCISGTPRMSNQSNITECKYIIYLELKVSNQLTW